MTNPSRHGDSYRVGIADRLLAGLMTLAIAVALVKVSLLNSGALLAPGLAVLLLAAVVVAQRALGPGRGRSILSALAVGLLGLVALFALALALLLIADSNRGT
ncbi:MAG TPA: hypothetical protein VID95_01945 [Candidatus Limnocylindrales bacterium]|jgi:hypothetical protein